jgi:PAS domain S-box-containing protein
MIEKSFGTTSIAKYIMYSTLIIVMNLFVFASISIADEPIVNNIQSIRSAAEKDYPPFSIVDENGRASGFSVDLLSAALKTMGRDVVYDTGTWTEVRNMLEQGKIDALPIVGRTPEREAMFDFTVPYMTLHGAIVVRNDETSIDELSDLNGKRVSVMKGDNAEEFLLRENRGINIYSTPTFEDALFELSKGRCDAVLMQRLVALRLIQKIGLTDLRIIDKPVEGFKQEFCFAVHDGDRRTLALLNEGLAIVIADGTYNYLYSKWFADLILPTDRTIIVGGDSNYPQFEFIDENGRPAGYNVDLVRAIAMEMGLNIDIRLGNWTERLDALEKGRIDIMQGMFYTPSRDLKFDFSQPHMVSNYVAVVRKGEGKAPESLNELKGKSIVVENGDILHDFVIEKGLEKQVYLAEDQEDALRQLSEGKYDCALVSLITAHYSMEKNKWTNLVHGKKPIVEFEYCFAVANGNRALLAKFSEGLKAIESSGAYKRINDKWFGVYKKESIPLDIVLRYALFVGILLVVMMLAVFIWLWALKRQVAEKTKALRASEEYQRAIIACSPVALYSTDTEGRVLSWNISAERIFGWNSEEVLGRFLPIVPPESMDEFHSIRNDILSGNIFIGKELVRLKKDGTRVFVSLSVAPIRNDKGELIGVLGAAEDITLRKDAQLRIEHLNKVLRAIRDINQLIVREHDRKKLICEGCRLLVFNRGYSSAMIILLNGSKRPVAWAMEGLSDASDELKEKLKNGLLPQCIGHIQDKTDILLVETKKATCNGCPLMLDCYEYQSLCTCLIHNNNLLGYLIVAAEKGLVIDDEELNLIREVAGDLSFALSVIKTQEEQERLQSQLFQAQKMESVGRLAGGVAHDYNNMLGVIMGYTELALETLRPEDPLYNDLTEIQKAALRSADITKQLLAFARKQTIDPKILDLNETVEGLLKMLRRFIGEDIDLSWQPGAGLWPVKIDPSQVNQILANLCVNARDAIFDIGKITIETGNVYLDEEYCTHHSGFKPGEYVMLAVSDNGCGMDKQTLDMIFEPFFTTKEVGKGTGRGLAMLYGIVKQNEGFINVYSEKGKGTTFRLYLPRHGDVPEYKEETDPKAIPMGKGETILILEDEQSILKLARAILENLVITCLRPQIRIRLLPWQVNTKI